MTLYGRYYYLFSFYRWRNLELARLIRPWSQSAGCLRPHAYCFYLKLKCPLLCEPSDKKNWKFFANENTLNLKSHTNSDKYLRLWLLNNQSLYQCCFPYNTVGSILHFIYSFKCLLKKYMYILKYYDGALPLHPHPSKKEHFLKKVKPYRCE